MPDNDIGDGRDSIDLDEIPDPTAPTFQPDPTAKVGRSKPMELGEVLARKKPQERSYTIVLDADAVTDDYETAKWELTGAEGRDDIDPAEIDRLRGVIRDHERRMIDDGAVMVWTFRAIGRDLFDEVLAEHAPTDAQTRRHRATGAAGTVGELGYNPETYPPALVAACLVDPPWSKEEVLALWKSSQFNRAELESLFAVALDVNMTRRTVDLGKDSGVTAAFGAKSNGAPRTPSPTRSS